MLNCFYFDTSNNSIQVSKNQLKSEGLKEIIPIWEDGKLGRWRWGFDNSKEITSKLLCHCKVYVFAPGHYAYDEEFENVIDKIELCALPEAIYRACKAVPPKAKQNFLDGVEKTEG